MIQLSYEEKKGIGFQYLLDCMNPSSPYGRERAKQISPYGRGEQEKLERDLDRIGHMRAVRDSMRTETDHLRRVFMRMKDIRKALNKAGEMCLDDLEFFEIKNFLLCVKEASDVWENLSRAAGIEDVSFHPVEAPLGLLDPDGKGIPTFSIYDSYSPALGKIRREKRAVEKELMLAEDGGQKQQLLEKRRLAAVQEEEEEQAVRRMLTEKLCAFLPEIRHNIETAGEIDLLLEKTDASFLAPSVRPVVGGTVLELENMTNPYVASVLEKKGLSFTPLSISLEEGATVITGANMGGKSVSLHTVVLNVFLSLCGFYAYADAARIPFFDDIQVLALEEQSVDRGLSSFGAQIVRLKEIIGKTAEGFCLVVLDEFSRGTNPHEGEALVRAVTRYLNGRHVIALLVTHFDHVAEYGRSHYQVVGLKDMDVARVRAEIAAAGGDAGVAVIASHMNYGLYRVDAPADCPKDAFCICGLLGLQQEILDYAEDTFQGDFYSD